MVQSAPLNHGQRIRRETVDIRKSFYCAAKLFKDNAGSPNKTKISDINKTAVLCQLLNHFSEECKDFTKAMSLKHQLQDYLFNQYNLSLTAKQVYSILVGLQTTANILDQYQFSQHNKTCPRLSAAQYKMMYHVKCYNISESLLRDIKTLGDSWVHDNYHIYGGNKPSPDCKQLFQ